MLSIYAKRSDSTRQMYARTKNKDMNFYLLNRLICLIVFAREVKPVGKELRETDATIQTVPKRISFAWYFYGTNAKCAIKIYQENKTIIQANGSIALLSCLCSSILLACPFFAVAPKLGLEHRIKAIMFEINCNMIPWSHTNKEIEHFIPIPVRYMLLFVLRTAFLKISAHSCATFLAR